MIAAAGQRRNRAGFGIFTLSMVAVFIGLGVWQLERRADEQERRAQADAALALAEDIAEHVPQALLSSLPSRLDRRSH